MRLCRNINENRQLEAAKPFNRFPRAAWEPSADAPASRSVTLARRQLHFHAARGNENLLETSWVEVAIKFTSSKRLTF